MPSNSWLNCEWNRSQVYLSVCAMCVCVRAFVVFCCCYTPFIGCEIIAKLCWLKPFISHRIVCASVNRKRIIVVGLWSVSFQKQQIASKRFSRILFWTVFVLLGHRHRTHFFLSSDHFTHENNSWGFSVFFSVFLLLAKIVLMSSITKMRNKIFAHMECRCLKNSTGRTIQIERKYFCFSKKLMRCEAFVKRCIVVNIHASTFIKFSQFLYSLISIACNIHSWKWFIHVWVQVQTSNRFILLFQFAWTVYWFLFGKHMHFTAWVLFK